MTLLPHPTDGCPACLAHARTVTTQPSMVRRDGPALLAEYQCPECGHQWRCWWDAVSLAARERKEVA